jgi:uncharacterized cupin superfamily protein
MVDSAYGDLEQIKKSHKAKILRKKIKDKMKLLQENPRHNSLNSHEYLSLSKRYGVKIFGIYIENNTPGAYRLFWHYYGQDVIRIVAITPHL